MNIEIIKAPIRFHLHGNSGAVENERYAEVGLRLMNEMWQIVKGGQDSDNWHQSLGLPARWEDVSRR
jgi:hypothetical protein